MTGKEMLKLFLKDGWKIMRIKGSHHQLTKNNQVETIPVHHKELGKKLETVLFKRLKEVK